MSVLTDDEISALLDGATPGPWRPVFRVRDGSCFIKMGSAITSSKQFDVSLFEDEANDPIDANLLCAAPSLAAEVLRLREVLRQIANAYDDCTGGPRFVEIAAAALKGSA